MDDFSKLPGLDQQDALAQISPEKKESIEQLELIEALSQKYAEKPLSYMLFNEPQVDIVHQVSIHAETGKFIFYKTCSNRNGKSVGVMSILAALCTDNRDSIFSLLPKVWPYSKKVWIVASADNVKENLLDVFEEKLGKAKYKAYKHNRPYKSEYIFPNGWQVYVKTFDQEDEKFESTTLGMVIGDEPMPASIFKACRARLMQGGIMLLTATPLQSSAFLNDTLLDESATGVWHRTASIWENVKETAGTWSVDAMAKKYGYDPEKIAHFEGQNKGFLDKEFIDRIIATFDKEEYDARVYGIPTHLSGRIYSMFNTDTHVIDHETMISAQGYCRGGHWKDWNYFMCIDPHNRRPCFVTWMAVHYSGLWYVVEEWPRAKEFDKKLIKGKWEQEFNGEFYDYIKNYNGTYRDVIKEIKQTEIKLGWHNKVEIGRYIDPNFGASKIQATGRTVIEEFEWQADDLGLDYFFEKGNNDLEYGIAATKTVLAVDEYGDPGMVIGDNCQNTIRAFKIWKFIDFTGKAAEDKSLSERVSEKMKDPCDNPRYILTTNNVPVKESYTEHLKKVLAEQQKKDYSKRVSHLSQSAMTN